MYMDSDNVVCFMNFNEDKIDTMKLAKYIQENHKDIDDVCIVKDDNYKILLRTKEESFILYLIFKLREIYKEDLFKYIFGSVARGFYGVYVNIDSIRIIGSNYQVLEKDHKIYPIPNLTENTKINKIDDNKYEIIFEDETKDIVITTFEDLY